MSEPQDAPTHPRPAADGGGRDGSRVIHVGTFGGLSAFPVLMATELGWFTEAGLDVRRDVTHDSDALARGLRDGELQVVHAAPDNVIAWNDGLDLEVRAWLAGASGPIALVSRVGPTLEPGARVGVDLPVSGFVPILRALLDRAGVRPDGVELVAAGATRLRYAALRDGELDATLLTLPWSRLAERDGAAILGDHRDVAPDLSTSCAASTIAWLETQGQAASAYADVVGRATAWLREPSSRAPARALLASDMGIDASLADDLLAVMLDPSRGWPAVLDLRGDELEATWRLRAASIGAPLRPARAYVHLPSGRT